MTVMVVLPVLPATGVRVRVLLLILVVTRLVLPDEAVKVSAGMVDMLVSTKSATSKLFVP